MTCSRLASGGKPAAAAASAASSAACRDAERAQAGPGDQGVAPAVRAEQAERRHPVRARVVVRVHPLHPRPEQRGPLPEQVAVPVGDGQVGTGLGAGGQLVPVVVLDAAVPGQVIGVQRGHRDHRRRAGQVGGLVAGGLDHPVVVARAGVRVPRRPADVPAGQAPVAEPGQQVPGDGGGAALALGPGDAHHPLPGCLRQPQPQPARHRDAAGFQLPQVVAVAADAGGLDHDLAAGQRRQPAAGGGQDRLPGHRPRGRAVIDQHRGDPERSQLAQVGQALDAEAPQADGAAGQLRPGDRRAHSHPG